MKNMKLQERKDSEIPKRKKECYYEKYETKWEQFLKDEKACELGRQENKEKESKFPFST